MNGLTFAELREANVARCEASFHPINDWSIDDWGCALLGEIGETANLIKKRRRGDHVETRAIADELADVVIYLDLLRAVVVGMTEHCQGTYGQIAADVACDVGESCVQVTPGQFVIIIALECTHILEVSRSLRLRQEHNFGVLLYQVFSLAHAMSIDLEKAIIRKFNEVSDRVGSDIRLGSDAQRTLTPALSPGEREQERNL